MKFEIIGQNFYECKEYDESMGTDSMIAFYERQQAIFDSIYTEDTKVIIHYLESDHYTIGYTSEINDYIDCLAIKDGVNIVRFENGNIGFMAYYSGYENGFEIMPLSMEIERK